MAEADLALQRVRQELQSSRQEGSFDGELLLQEVNEELSKASKSFAGTEDKLPGRTSHTAANLMYSGNASDYLLTKCAPFPNCLHNALQSEGSISRIHLIRVFPLHHVPKQRFASGI